MNKTGLITGVTGQDGAYLSRLLLEKGYEVWGTYRPGSTINTWRLEELGVADEINSLALELLEYENISRVIEQVQPDEIYNLAAQSFVGASFEQPIYTGKANALGVGRILEVIRDGEIKFYQASTSEMFGNVDVEPQSEDTSFCPESPYAISKLYAHQLTRNYRESYGLSASCGILFNHESPLRGEQFVTRKITSSLARIKSGQQDVLELGNLSAERDWGFAGDYVEAMWKMLQQETPDDYVVGTGDSHSVREFVESAGNILGYDLVWEGEGLDEEGYDRNSGKKLVQVNEEFYRPVDVHNLRADASKAREELDWKPKHSFEQLVEKMVEADMDRISQ
ncbi:MAG: GDP-mannose 4,6-dehydratase [bacterium]